MESLQLDSGLLRREPPAHLGFQAVAVGFPGTHFVGHPSLAIHPPVRTSSGRHTQFHLRDVQPTAMLGGRVKLRTITQPLGFLRRTRAPAPARPAGVIRVTPAPPSSEAPR